MECFSSERKFQQLLYTRVEAKYSPIGRAGFQTIFRDELAQKTVDEIESKIRHYCTPVTSYPRLQFFLTQDDFVVLSHTVNVESHPEIIDHSQRPGAFLVHCLVIGASDFHRRWSNNPFFLFDSFQFIQSPVLFFEELNGQPRDPQYSYGAQHEEARELSVRHVLDALSAVFYMATNNAESPLMMDPDADQCTRFLRLLFRLLPIRQRLSCTFDTHVDNLAVMQTEFHIICNHCGRKTITVPHVPYSLWSRFAVPEIESDSPYLSWLAHVQPLIKGNRKIPRNFYSQVTALCSADDKYYLTRAFDSSELSRRTLSELTDASIDRFEALVIQAASRQFPHELAIGVSESFVKICNRDQKLDISLTGSIDASLFQKAVTKYVNEHDSEVGESGWKAIKTYASASNDMYLLFVASVMTKRVDTRSRDRALLSMKKEDYLTLVRLRFCDPIEPRHFIKTSHLSTLLHPSRIDKMTNEQVIDLIVLLIKENRTNYLSRLIPRIEKLDLQSLKALDRATRREKGVPRKFRNAIASSRSMLQERNEARRFWFLNNQTE